MKHDSINQRVHDSQDMSVLISRYRPSGLSLKRFDQEQAIPYGRLHYWLYGKSRPTVPKHPMAMQTARPVFQEVKLTSCLPGMTGGWAAEISLPAG